MRHNLIVPMFSLAWACCIAQTAPSTGEYRRKLEAERLHRGAPATVSHAPGTDPRQDKAVAESMHRLIAIFEADSGRIVIGKPFSADTLTRSEQIFGETTGHLFRDSHGRTRRDQTIRDLGAEFTVITDPVRQVDLILDPRRKTLRKFATTRMDSESVPQPGNDLGERVIEGMLCRGRRLLTKVAGGVEIVTDIWYAPAIETNISWIKTDPRYGKTTWSLLHIRLTEPPLEVFQAPADYTVEFEGPAGVMMQRKVQ